MTACAGPVRARARARCQRQPGPGRACGHRRALADGGRRGRAHRLPLPPRGQEHARPPEPCSSRRVVAAAPGWRTNWASPRNRSASGAARWAGACARSPWPRACPPRRSCWSATPCIRRAGPTSYASSTSARSGALLVRLGDPRPVRHPRRARGRDRCHRGTGHPRAPRRGRPWATPARRRGCRRRRRLGTRSPAPGQAAGVAGWKRLKTAPCGSLTVAMGPIGVGIGPFITFAPSWRALSRLASMSSTAK